MFYYKNPLGYLLLTVNDGGYISLASFSDDVSGTCLPDGALKDVLTAYFSVGAQERKPKDIQKLDKLFAKHIDISALPGTPFQKSVWEALATIPYGEVRSYKEIGALIGKPNASRAVGTACSKNPVALLVSCHRVVKTSGEIFNYAWGKERKAWLLSHENGSEVRPSQA